MGHDGGWGGKGAIEEAREKDAIRKVEKQILLPRMESTGLPVGCQSVGLRERDLRKGHWIWDSSVLSVTLDNRCQVHIYLI